MMSTKFEPVHFRSAEAEITGDEITEILAFLQSGELESNPRDTNRMVEPVDERKRKRTISNRESAKRSRLRKKRHLEELTEEVNRVSLENRELTNRLTSLLYYGNVISRDNNRLETESVYLELKLVELYRVLVAMQSSISMRYKF